MRKTLLLIQKGFRASKKRTPEFIVCAEMFVSEFQHQLQVRGATKIAFDFTEPFIVKGTFTTKTRELYALSYDVRNENIKVLYWKVEKHPKVLLCTLSEESVHNLNIL